MEGVSQRTGCCPASSRDPAASEQASALRGQGVREETQCRHPSERKEEWGSGQGWLISVPFIKILHVGSKARSCRVAGPGTGKAESGCAESPGILMKPESSCTVGSCRVQEGQGLTLNDCTFFPVAWKSPEVAFQNT